MSNILITGCNSGIGFATAVLLARNNHTVFATMRDLSKKAALQDITEKDRLPVIIFPMDVLKEDSIKIAVDIAIKKMGNIDVLINNAGIGSLGAVEELPMDSFVAEMNTNYLGTVRCTKAVLPHMRENNSGCIINISSVGGRLFNYFGSSYSASKAAVEAFSECLAMEMVPFNVRVAVVEPGVIDTPLQKKSRPGVSRTHYPYLIRAVAFFSAATNHHVPPEVVAGVVNDIVIGNNRQFRNPAGPDSKPVMDARATFSDEDWIASAAMDEERWIASMEAMHLDVRKYLDFSKP